MKTHKIKLVVTMIFLATMLTGCFAVDGYFKSMRNKVLRSVDADFDREIEFGVGASGIMFGSMVVSFSDAEHYVDDMMRKIDRVQIGVYKKAGYGRLNMNFKELKRITEELKDNDYKFIVRSVNYDEMVAVMVKNDAGYRLNEMFIVALSDDELVMTQVFGDLDELIEIAIREEGFKIDVAHN